MKLTEYTVTTTFGQFRFAANLAEAAAPLVSIHDADGDEPKEEWSPYQTADAGHDARRAAELLLRHYGPAYYLDPDDDRDDLDHDEYVRGLILSVEPTK